MVAFQVHSVETAPEGSKPLLKSLKENLGMVPNLAAAMSESPQLLAGFLAVRDIYTGGVERSRPRMSSASAPRDTREPKRSKWSSAWRSP